VVNRYPTLLRRQQEQEHWKTVSVFPAARQTIAKPLHAAEYLGAFCSALSNEDDELSHFYGVV
jgi:hypothetical protein